MHIVVRFGGVWCKQVLPSRTCGSVGIVATPRFAMQRLQRFLPAFILQTLMPLAGYCDIFRKCRSVDANGPLARLKNLLFNKQTIKSVSQWAHVSYGSIGHHEHENAGTLVGVRADRHRGSPLHGYIRQVLCRTHTQHKPEQASSTSVLGNPTTSGYSTGKQSPRLYK